MSATARTVDAPKTALRARGAECSPMHAASAARQPAPMLARGAVWLGLRVRPDAFGNALGDSLGQSALSAYRGSEQPQVLNTSYGDGDIGRSELRVDDRMPDWDQQADNDQIVNAFGQHNTSFDSAGDVHLAAGPGYTGLGNVPAPPRAQEGETFIDTWGRRTVVKDGLMVPVYELDPVEVIGSRRPSFAAMESMAQAYRESGLTGATGDPVEFAFSDGRDARDIRQSFAYQSRVSRELRDLAYASNGVPLGRGSPGAYMSAYDPVMRLNTEGGGYGPGSIDALNPNWILDFESNASLAGHVTLGSQLAVLGWAKSDALNVLQRAAPLLNNKQSLVGAASTLADAAAVFRSPTGASAQSLAWASTRYGGAIRSLGYLGTAANVAEETAFVVRSSEHGFNYKALGASATNLTGDAFSTLGGIQAGAAFGALFGPVAPITIPAFAAVGGFAGHYGWDTWAKPFYRQIWTGVPEPK